MKLSHNLLIENKETKLWQSILAVTSCDQGYLSTLDAI